MATFHGMTAARSLQLQNISKGRNVLFVQDNNDNIWMCGHKDGCVCDCACVCVCVGV